MINAIETLSSDLHDARSEFLKSVHYQEDYLTPEGVEILSDIKQGLARLIDELELVLLNNGG